MNYPLTLAAFLQDALDLEQHDLVPSLAVSAVVPPEEVDFSADELAFFEHDLEQDFSHAAFSSLEQHSFFSSVVPALALDFSFEEALASVLEQVLVHFLEHSVLAFVSAFSVD